MTYLAGKGIGNSKEILDLPHSHYMSFLKHAMTFDLQQTEEGQETLDKFNRYMNPRTDADLGSIRQLAGYNKS